MFKQHHIDQRLRQAARDGAGVGRVRHLLEEGADQTSLDERRCTALYYAVAYVRTHLLTVLLSTGAMLRDVISPSAARSYTHVAIDRDHARALRQLLQLGCDVNVQRRGFTLLTYALSKRSYECATVLLDDGRCDVNAQAHSAARKHPLDCVLFNMHRRRCVTRELQHRSVLLTRMLERGRNINCERHGWSPLNYCIRHQYDTASSCWSIITLTSTPSSKIDCIHC